MIMRKKVIILNDIIQIAKKYKYLKDFRVNEPIAYKDAIKIKKLHILRKFLMEARPALNEKKVRLIAKKYKTRYEFCKKEPSCYNWILRHKKHHLMKHQKEMFKYRSISSALAEAKKYKDYSQLIKNRGLHSFLRRNNLLSHKQLNHIIKNDFNYKKERLFKEIKSKKIKYLDEIYTKKSYWYRFIRWNNLKKTLLLTLIDRGHPLSWDKQMVRNAIKKYKSIKDLKSSKYSLYERALYFGLIPGKNTKKNKQVHSYQNIMQLCSNCRSKQEFIVKHKAAYNSVLKQKIKLPLPDLSSNTSIGEKVLRNFLEEVFQTKFPTMRPDFMKNPDSKRKLELDGYCSKLKIAFEHQGSQHYKPLLFFKKNNKKAIDEFTTTQRNDKNKIFLCKKEGVTLLIVPDILHILKFDPQRIKEIIAKQLKDNGRKVPQRLWSIQINFNVK